MAIIVLVVAVFSLSRVKVCNSTDCFFSNMVRCDRATYIGQDTNAFWEYEIKGKSRGECVIDVKLLQVVDGPLDLANLEGLEMICKTPIGVASYANQDLENCEGPLRTGFQKIIIETLHEDIVSNIDELFAALQEPEATGGP